MFQCLRLPRGRTTSGLCLSFSVAFTLLFITTVLLFAPQVSAQYLFNEMAGNRNSMSQGMVPGLAGSPGDSTWAIAQGDFNRDGRIDIAVVLNVTCGNPAGNCWVIQTYLGQPDGSYALSSTLNAGEGGALAVGDVNGDGIPDIVFATSGASPPQTLFTYIGKGDGTFQSPGVVAALSEADPFSLALGDFNGDGKLDVVIGDAGSSDVYLHIGNGDGTFSSGTANSLQMAPQQVLVADMNRDGKLDIVISESPQTVSVLLGNGDGTFAPEIASSSPGSNDFHIAVGDLNGDGIPDVVVSGDQLNVFLGNGDGTLQPPVATNLNVGTPGPIITGDFNGDGITDIAMGGGWTGVLALFGNNDGTFRTPGSVYGSLGNGYPSLIVAGDYNNDGNLDIATAPFADGGEAFSILANNGDGTFGAGGDLVAGLNPASFITADFNGDGFPDFAIANASDPIRIYLGAGGGHYGPPQTFSVGNSTPLNVVAGDFNRDGKIDLATLNYDGSVSVLLGAGDGTFAAPLAYAGLPTGKSPLQLATGDLNHDGIPDLVILRDPDGNVSVLLGNGDGSFQSPYTVNTGLNSEAWSMQLADVNRDGNLDILVNGVIWIDPVAFLRNYPLEVLLGKGDGTFEAGMSSLPSQNAQGQGNPQPASFAVADLRGNGILDIVSAESSALYVWPGNGDGTFGQPIANYGLSGEGSQIVFGDFNGDGKTDVAMCGNNGAVWVSLGNGDDTFGPQLMYNIPRTDSNSGCVGVVAGDFNGDGSLDLAGLSNTVNGSLTLMLSNPVAAFSTSNLAFGEVSVGLISAPITVTLSNPSPTIMKISSVTIAGANAGDFAQTNTCGATLAPGGGCTVSVTFSPSTGGARNASLTFTDNSGAGIQNVALNGAGDQTNPAAPIITWLTPTPMTYGSALNVAQLNATASVPGTFAYTPVPGSVLHAGTQTLSVTFTPNSASYTPVTSTVSLVVSPAPLTITGPSLSVPYGSSAQALGPPSYAGFVNGDGPGSFTTPPTCVTTYTPTSPAGSAQATNCSGAVAADYVIAYVNGALTVTKATPVINWTFPASIVYGTPLGATQLNASFGGVTGLATYSPALGTVLGAGDQTLQVTFVPTDATDYNLPAPTTVLILVTKVPLTVAAQSASKVYGAALPTLTYTLTGFVNSDTSTAISGAPVLSTTATAASPVGSYLISAAVGSLAAANYSFVSANGTLTVTQAASTVSASSSANPVSTGQQVTFTAAVAPQFGGTAAGTVTFKDGATVLDTSAVAGDSASFSTSTLAAGSHSITASYSGDSNVLASTSAALSEIVNGLTSNATATILESSVNPAYLSQPVTYTAAVSSTAGVPSGNVTFRQGATTLAVVPLAGGAASYTTNYTSPGSHSVTAVYGGSGSFKTSTSAVLTEVIKSLPATTATTLMLTSGLPSYPGQMVTLTATVSSNYEMVPNGEVVSFTSGSTVIGTASLSSGVAVLNISTLTAGTHSIRATYGGDTFLARSTSAAVSVLVSHYPTTTMVNSNLNPSSFGNTVVLSASVASAGPNTPAGTVTFKDGTANLGTATLTGGTASLSKGNLAVGSHSITVVYNGDTQNATSISSALTQAVNPASTTTSIRTSINPSKAGQSVRFSVSVMSTTGATPAGTVTFVAGSSTLGTVTLAGGTASVSTTALPSGTTTITATYNGSASMKSSSASMTQTVH